MTISLNNVRVDTGKLFFMKILVKLTGQGHRLGGFCSVFCLLQDTHLTKYPLPFYVFNFKTYHSVASMKCSVIVLKPVQCNCVYVYMAAICLTPVNCLSSPGLSYKRYFLISMWFFAS